jgi:DNA-binding PucR family transcriptional regulator
VLDPDALDDRARAAGVDTAASHVVVVARHAGDDPALRRRAAFWAASHAAAEGGLAVTRGDETVLLLPGDEPGAVARRVARELSAGLASPTTAGAAGPVTHLATGVAAGYHEARRCAEALVSLGRTGEGASADELGFVGLLLGDDHDVTGYLDAALGPVLRYDARRGTELVGTLEAYFAAGAGLARTGERLHIHVNTVTQRLERIASLLGEDWQSPDRALELQLALRLHRLRGA